MQKCLSSPQNVILYISLYETPLDIAFLLINVHAPRPPTLYTPGISIFIKQIVLIAKPYLRQFDGIIVPFRPKYF